ncbi:MAG: hypothetical protein HKM02_03450 [Pseudomonadales bacterium]|nr:hypothetical protein [Pseudomonadales bacterium]
MDTALTIKIDAMQKGTEHDAFVSLECAVCQGLAPFLRMSLAGEDLIAKAGELMERVRVCPEDAGSWRDASIALSCLGQAELAQQFLEQALSLCTHYKIQGSASQPILRVLMLMQPGELSANTPLECLLEQAPVEIVQALVTSGQLSSLQVPEHDVLFMAVAESPASQNLLHELELQLASWPRPVINTPQAVLGMARDRVAQLLQGIEGLVVPVTTSYSRATLQPSVLAYPIIIRPLGSQAGHDLACLQHPDELIAYLHKVQADTFYVAPFVDYADRQGLYAKMRIALIDGEPWPCHRALSAHWMVHYVNAGMYEDAAKRAQELIWMQTFSAFLERHVVTLNEVAERLQLPYVLLDLAELQDGRLLLFEADPAMVVHAMDSVELFPYKQVYMGQLREAVVASLVRHAGDVHGVS